MLRFCGYDLELVVDDVLAGGAEPTVCSARDEDGARWLIVQVDDDPVHLSWLCAPVSTRALQAIRDGRGAAADALRHSSTGTVELVTVDHGHATPDRCLLGAEVAARLSTPTGRPAVFAA